MNEIANYPCAGCGCVCDDVVLHMDGDRVADALHACELGKQFLTATTNETVEAMVDGQSTSADIAIDRAAHLLATARLPLICGLRHATIDSQREAIAVADICGACIDSGGSAERLFPNIGSITCSLGEMMNRSDLVVLWGGRPLETHPRLLSRYCPAECEVVVVTDQEIGDEFAALWVLRAVVRGKVVHTRWTELANRLKAAKCAVIVHSGSGRPLEAAYGLAADVNDFTRCYVLPLCGPGNPTGATQAITWQTGYPAAVGMHRGYPRSFGSEFSMGRLIDHSECDLVLVVGHHPPFSSQGPQIHIAPTPLQGTSVFVACATFPTCDGGTIFRLDGITLPLPIASRSSLPTDFQVLRLIGQRLRTMRAGH